MQEEETIVMEQLSIISVHIYEMANKNLEQLSGEFQERDETDDFYLGILRRQAMLTYDLSTLFKDRPAENLSTPYIILRSLLDDFLHLLYLELIDNRDEQIICINAKGHNDNFKSLVNLTNSENQEQEGESFGYLSDEQLEEVKRIFKSKEKNVKYFDDIDEFKFKKFISMYDLANSINNSKSVNIARDRAYYLWKDFSSFVHYSNWSFEFEMKEDVLKLRNMEMALEFVFNTTILASKYFQTNHDKKCHYSKFLLKEMKFGVLDINY